MRVHATVAGLGATVALVAAMRHAEAGDPPPIAGLTLEKAVELAATRNERAAISDQNVVVADAAVIKARAAWLPLIAVGNANVTWKPFDVASKASTANPNLSEAAALTVTQPLFVPTAYPLFHQAKNNLIGQRERTVDDKRVLGFDTAHAYLAVLLADAVVKDAEKKLHTAKEDLDATTAQFKAQLVSINDQTRAQIELSGAVRELEQDKGALEQAYIQLEFLISAIIDRQIVPPTALIEASAIPPPTPQALLAAAWQRRPDLRSKRDDAVAAHDFASEPHLRFVPTLSAVATGLASSNGEPNNHDFDAQLALVASWSIFDGLSRDADEQSRGAQAVIADLNADALQRSVTEQIKLAIAQLVSAQAELVAAKDAATAGEKSATETSILYTRGLATALELTDANDSRFEADVALAQAQDTVAEAYLSLRQAMGLEAIGTELK